MDAGTVQGRCLSAVGHSAERHRQPLSHTSRKIGDRDWVGIPWEISSYSRSLKGSHAGRRESLCHSYKGGDPVWKTSLETFNWG